MARILLISTQPCWRPGRRVSKKILAATYSTDDAVLNGPSVDSVRKL
jgi:hypothetical protein